MANSHKQEANARRRPRAVVVAGPLAAMATASAVTLGVFASSPNATILAEDAVGTTVAADLGTLGSVVDRGENVSRSAARSADQASTPLEKAPAQPQKKKAKKPTKAQLQAAKILDPKATRKALARADQKLYTTGVLNLWTAPGDEAKKLGEVDSGKQVLVTGRNLFGRDEIVVRGKSRWVTSGYLSADEPVEEIGLGGTCSNGTSTSGGANVQAVHNAVCAVFPEIQVYGGIRSGGGDHGAGRAVDIMVSGSRGQEVADFVRANAGELGVSYVIYSQQIWSVERGGEGWRGMSDRGSVTANHYDHVHVSVF